MAMKGPRVVLETDITLTCESVAERGRVLVHKTGSAGSGVALGSSAGKADLVSNASGYKVAGVLYNDVVSYDTTRYHGNFHKDETRTGERCNLLKKGRLTVDGITGTPAIGETAYLDSSGTIINAAHATGGLVARPKLGTFASIKDENGFAAIDFNLPVV